jgi:membrane protein
LTLGQELLPGQFSITMYTMKGLRTNSRLRRFLRREASDRPKAVQAVSRFFRYQLLIFREFSKDNCIIRASGLSFSSILAIVPLSAVVFSLFSAFGAFDQIQSDLQEILLDVLIPTRQENIIRYINQFVDNARTLGAFGILIFTFTSVMLIHNIEKNFNAIIGLKSNRKIISRFTAYTAVLFFGTLLIGASLSVRVWVSGLISSIGTEEINQLYEMFLKTTPTLFIFVILGLLILIVPDMKIKPASAFWGALYGTVLWQIAKSLFVLWVNRSIRISVIYGSIVLIPIVLLWVYIAWIIVLFSLETTYVHQKGPLLLSDEFYENVSPRATFTIGFRIYTHIAREFAAGNPPPDLNALSKELTVPISVVRHFLDVFLLKSLILSIGQEEGFVPSKPPQSQRISEILAVLYSGGKTNRLLPSNRNSVIFIHRIESIIAGEFKSMTVSEILDDI